MQKGDLCYKLSNQQYADWSVIDKAVVCLDGNKDADGGLVVY